MGYLLWHKYTLNVFVSEEHISSTMGKKTRRNQQAGFTVISEDELKPMANHVAVCCGKSLVTFGGYDYDKRMRMFPHSFHDIYEYNTDSGQWKKHTIPETETVPSVKLSVVANAACYAVVVKNNIYFYLEDVWKLSKTPQKNFTWTKVDVQGIRPCYRTAPSYWEFDDKMWLFAGYLDSIPFRDGEYNFTSFDFSSRQFSNVQSFGEIPSSRIEFEAAKLGSKVYLYGGRHDYNIRLDDLYVLDMNSLTWTQLYPAGPLQPVARGGHTFTAISDTEIMLHAGYLADTLHANDTWILDITSLSWKECSQSEHKKRSWHSATNIDGSVIIIGGLDCGNPPNRYDWTTHSDVFHITHENRPKALEQLSLRAVHKHKDLLTPTDRCMPEELYARFCDM